MYQKGRVTVEGKKVQVAITDDKGEVKKWVGSMNGDNKLKKKWKKTGKVVGISTFGCPGGKQPPHTMAVAVGKSVLVVDLLNIKSEVPSQLYSLMRGSRIGGYMVNEQLSKLGLGLDFPAHKVECDKSAVALVDYHKNRFGEISVPDGQGAGIEAYLSYKVAEKSP